MEKRIFICNVHGLFSFKFGKRYETDENGYFDFGGGLKANLAKNDNFIEYKPRYCDDNKYYFVRDRWAKNTTRNLPFIVLEELEDDKVVLYRLPNYNIMAMPSHATLRNDYARGNLSNDKNVCTEYISHFEERHPFLRATS